MVYFSFRIRQCAVECLFPEDPDKTIFLLLGYTNPMCKKQRCQSMDKFFTLIIIRHYDPNPRPLEMQKEPDNACVLNFFIGDHAIEGRELNFNIAHWSKDTIGNLNKNKGMFMMILNINDDLQCVIPISTFDEIQG
ncbi:UNVERIFIED_CONTAM: hypothetical protein K2H54_029965 [Gekko kuhli]